MNPTIRAELLASVKDLRALGASIGHRADRLEKLLQDTPEPPPGTDPYKRADGRLTEAGIAAVNAAFDAGATVTEVSKTYGIHVSAASNRKKIWQASKAGATA